MPVPFKIKQGLKGNLPSARTEGVMYVTTDTGEIFLDSNNSRISLYPNKLTFKGETAVLPLNPVPGDEYVVTDEITIGTELATEGDVIIYTSNNTWQIIHSSNITFDPDPSIKTVIEKADFTGINGPVGFNGTSFYQESSGSAVPASTITAGTLGGQVVANASAVATTNVFQVRNIYISTEDPTASDGNDGDIWIKYTP